jgi:hypothetical protein
MALAWVVVAGSAAQDCSDRASDRDGGAATGRATVEWAEGPDAGLWVTAPAQGEAGEEPMEVSVHLEAAFAATWTFQWDSDVVAVEPGTSVVLPVEIPRETFFHPESQRYVAILRAEVRSTAPVARRELETRFLLWPDGPDGSPEVIAPHELPSRAPDGTTVPHTLPVRRPTALMLIGPPIEPPELPRNWDGPVPEPPHAEMPEDDPIDLPEVAR